MSKEDLNVVRHDGRGDTRRHAASVLQQVVVELSERHFTVYRLVRDSSMVGVARTQ